ncbi:MAG TPA: iron ABC transporter permease [Castellaniella sp.]|uniref:FecCD family ABC transporter permease n=1 Tax=Castellaniella sp. TaxID=1955812 RepID=UPI002EF25A7D
MDTAPPQPTIAQYHRLTRRRWQMLGLLAVCLVASIWVDVLTGSSGLRWPEVLSALIHPSGVAATTRVILWDLRLPMALLAGSIGLALGQAGAEMQTLLDNPLASPFTLGVSSAAALGAALAIVFGLTLPGIPGPWMVAVNAFLFALAATWLLDLAARHSALSPSGIILFGIALVFSFNAILSLIQYVASAEALQGLVFWTMGSLSQASWPRVGLMLGASALLLPLALFDRWRLTALRLGEDRATSFGVDVRHLRRKALTRVSLLAALAVSFAGTIGFVGLVAPHIARRLFGEDHRFYLPGSALMGGLILSLAAVVSKNLVAGVIVPVGIVTSLVGIPFFVGVMLRHPLR